MTLRIPSVALGIVWLMCTGCGVLETLVNLFPSRDVTVRLVNAGEFAVEVKLFISDQQDIPEQLLDEVGTELDFTVPAGETTTFSRSCNDLQAIVVDDAQLLVIGGAGPHANSSVLRDSTNFGCGDVIVFSFDHSDLIVDFHVTSAVQGN